MKMPTVACGGSVHANAGSYRVYVNGQCVCECRFMQGTGKSVGMPVGSADRKITVDM